jgi:hypothetical protein
MRLTRLRRSPYQPWRHQCVQSLSPLEPGSAAMGLKRERRRGLRRLCDRGLPVRGSRGPGRVRLTCKDTKNVPHQLQVRQRRHMPGASGRFMVARPRSRRTPSACLVGDFDGDRPGMSWSWAPTSSGALLRSERRARLDPDTRREYAPVIGKLTPPHDVMGATRSGSHGRFRVPGEASGMRGPREVVRAGPNPRGRDPENTRLVFVIDAIQKIDASNFPRRGHGHFQKDASSTEFAFTFPDAVGPRPPNQPIPGPLLATSR